MLQTGGKLCNLQNFSIAEQYRLILEKNVIVVDLKGSW